MVIRYMLSNGVQRTKQLHAPGNTERDALKFLESLGSHLKGATLYRNGKPFASFAYVGGRGLDQTNP